MTLHLWLTDLVNYSAQLAVVITVGSNPTPTEQSQALVNTVVAANLPIDGVGILLALFLPARPRPAEGSEPDA